MSLNLVPSELRGGEIYPWDQDKDKNLLGTLDTYIIQIWITCSVPL